MDGLGMVAQQKEAEAVLATLWDVNDLSTSHIMSDFYARWVKNPAQGKAEALRQAQLAFLQGGAVAPGAKTGRGFQTSEVPKAMQSSLGYAHPYYWAPFVLIGNFNSASLRAAGAGLQTRTDQRPAIESGDPISS